MTVLVYMFEKLYVTNKHVFFPIDYFEQVFHKTSKSSIMLLHTAFEIIS